MRYALGTRVGDRGQITVEKEIRDRLGVRPGDRAVQHVEDGRLIVTFVTSDLAHERSLAGVLGPPPRRTPKEVDWNDLVGAAAAADYLAKTAPRRTG